MGCNIAVGIKTLPNFWIFFEEGLHFRNIPQKGLPSPSHTPHARTARARCMTPGAGADGRESEARDKDETAVRGGRPACEISCLADGTTARVPRVSGCCEGVAARALLSGA